MNDLFLFFKSLTPAVVESVSVAELPGKEADMLQIFSDREIESMKTTRDGSRTSQRAVQLRDLLCDKAGHATFTVNIVLFVLKYSTICT